MQRSCDQFFNSNAEPIKDENQDDIDSKLLSIIVSGTFL